MKSTFRILIIYLAIIELIILFYFIICQKPKPKEDESQISFLQIKSTWVDGLVKNLDTDHKIGQMIIVEADLSIPGIKDSLKIWIRKYQIGGIVFSNGSIYDQVELSDFCKAYSPIPLFIATKNIQPSDIVNFPSLLTLGAISDTSLIRSYADFKASAYNEMGVNLEFSNSMKIFHVRDTNRYQETFSDNLNNINTKAAIFNQENKRHKIINCIDQINHIHSDSDTLQLDSLMFLQKNLIKKGTPCLFVDRSIRFDKSKEKLKKNYLRKYFHDHLDFKGLIISEPPKNAQNGRSPIEECLFMGPDIVYLKNNISQSIDLIKYYIERGLKSDQAIGHSLRLILLAKAWTGYDRYRPANKLNFMSLLKNPGNKYLIQQIFENSITLIKNKPALVPFYQLNWQSFQLCVVGKNDLAVLNEIINKYTYCPSRSFSTFTNKEIEGLRKFHNLIIALNDVKIDTLINHSLLKTLNLINEKSSVVLLNFGNPQNIKFFNAFPSIVQVYENHPILQYFVPQVLFGAIPAKGKLPVTISTNFAFGINNSMNSGIRFKYSVPEDAEMNSDQLSKLDTLADYAINKKCFPGCQLMVIKDSKVVYEKAFGHFTYEKSHKVNLNDLYDLASITKVTATTLASMKLFEEDSINLTDSVKYYLDDTLHVSFKNTRLEEFFLHRSGLPPDMPILKFIIYRTWKEPRFGTFFEEKPDSAYSIEVAKDFYFRKDYINTIWDSICTVKIDTSKPYKYSDINLNIILRAITKKMTKPFDLYLNHYFYWPLDTRTIGFRPLKRFNKERIAPTQDDKFWRNQLIQGYPQDESAALYGGIAGNAGLFSNATDLAIIFQMLVNKGVYGGLRILKPETIEYFIKPQNGNNRGFGFTWYNNSYGHTGFTGTMVWANPDNKLIYILLSNRVYPRVTNDNINKLQIRDIIKEIIYSSIKK